MLTETRAKNFLLFLRRFAIIFTSIAFAITCCIILFLRTLNTATPLELTQASVTPAAKVTFLNILVLTLLTLVLDSLRRRFTVGRPVRRIAAAAEQVMQGDLSVRIPTDDSSPYDDFDRIIDYFNRMVQELSNMETLRTDFVANVSHELKTPLAVMQNYATMLQQPDLPEETRIEYAKTIADASRGLADMVANILKLNKLENQTIYPDTQTYDLSEQLCECLLGFEDVWERKDIDLETDIQEGVTVSADPELLSLVWNNLFSNAFKFTGDGGTVRLRLTAQDGTASVEVSDTGCGISLETGKHIFEKFYQGDTSHAGKGNGLGLALVKRVVDITGGDISVRSEVGKGSTFTVKLHGAKSGA